MLDLVRTNNIRQGGGVMEALIFSFLFTFFADDPLELGMGQLPDGRAVVVALTANPGGGTQLHSFIQTTAGDFSATAFQHQVVDTGQIFSISPQLIAVAGYLYMAAVCNYNACMYRLPVATQTWEGAQVLTTSNNIASASIALLGGTILALTMQNQLNELIFRQANANVALLSALLFTTLYPTLTNVANPFIGGHIAKSAFDTGSNESCHIYRQMSGVLVGNLVATCFVGAVATTVLLEALTNAQGFVNSIETRALFYAGAFYFMYFLANGNVRLAKLSNPFLTAQIVTLGAVALASGFPGMALALGVLGGNPYLFAYWPGHAVQIALATLVVTALQQFPLAKVGPMAALALLAASLTVFIAGTGSIAGTVMTQATVQPIPLFGGPWTIALAVLLAVAAIALWRRRQIVSDR